MLFRSRMKSEQTAVRTRIRTSEVQFRRLHQGLDAEGDAMTCNWCGLSHDGGPEQCALAERRCRCDVADGGLVDVQEEQVAAPATGRGADEGVGPAKVGGGEGVASKHVSDPPVV